MVHIERVAERQIAAPKTISVLVIKEQEALSEHRSVELGEGWFSRS